VHDTLREAVGCTVALHSSSCDFFLPNLLPLQTLTFETFATFTSQHKLFCMLLLFLLALVAATVTLFPTQTQALFHDCWKPQLTTMASNKAPTPRTSRNSRGLRKSPAIDNPLIGRRSSRRNTIGTTPASARIAESLTELPEPSTPTPVTRSRNIQTPYPQLVLAESLSRLEPTPFESTSIEPVTLEPIQEEQAPKTPAAASPINTARQQASTTPVSSYTPTGPSTFTPPTQRRASPLRHRRVALIKGTPVRPSKKTGPETPIYRPTRFLTRLVDRTPTPKPPPTPQSEGHETRRFAERRVQEDDDVEFAKGIYLAIRNDHRMRECWCPIPTIYNSKEEAEAGSGHFRFYIDDTQGPRSLRVLQKKDDFNWHCICAQEYHPVCFELLNKNGKRPAQDSELDLIVQNLGLEDSDSIKKVVTTPSEFTTAEEKPQQQGQWSMWTRARDLVSSVATMASPFTDFIGRIVSAARGDAYDTVDVRRTSQQDGTLVVKRFKRQLGRTENDEIDGLTWVGNPTDHIGRERLERLAQDFVAQANSIQESKIVTGFTIKDIITQEKLVGQGVIGISVAIYKYQETLFGPVTVEWSEVERAERFTEAVKRYIRNLVSTIEMMKNIYEPENLKLLRQEHPKPKPHLGLGNNEFRLAARKAGEFLLFFQSLVDLIPMDADMVQTIGQVIVDFDAVGKKELIPSLVTMARTPQESMPGYFPDEKPSLMEEVPIKDLSIQPLYEYRYPSPDASETDSTPGEPGDYRLIAKPKGILKASKTWNVPSTPKYVPTPQKSRKLVFESPISKFIAPSHIPSRVMTAREAELIIEAERKAELLGDEYSFRVLEATMTTNSRHDASQDQFRWSLRGVELEKDDREMGLTRLHEKFGKFLDDTREDLRLRNEKKRKQQEQEERSIYRMTPLKREIRIPRPPQFTAAERKRRAALAAASMPSPEPDSPISFSPWYRRPAATGRGYREEPSEEGEEGMVLAKTTPDKAGADVTKPTGREVKERPQPVTVLNPRPKEPKTTITRPKTTKLKVNPEAIFDEASEATQGAKPNQASVLSTPPPSKEGEAQTPVQQDRLRRKSASEQLFGADDDDGDLGAIHISRGLATAASEAERDDVLTKVQLKEEEEQAARRRIEEAEAAAKKKKEEEEEAKKRAAEEAQAKLLTPAALKQKRLHEAIGLRAPLKPLIRPLTDEWAAKVDAIPHQQAEKTLAETPAGPLGRKQLYDQLTVPDREMVWLNDEVITGTLGHLEKVMNKALGGTPEQPLAVCFDNYFWKTRIIDRKPFTLASMRAIKRMKKVTRENFEKIEYLLFPICHNAHWTLGVIRPRLKVVAHLNSMRERRGHNIAELLYIAKAFLEDRFVEDEWQDVSRYYNSPQQSGSDDCGVCTITNAECVLNGIDPTQAWQADDMKQPKRRMIAGMLLNGGYTGDFSLEGV
ncbi:putative ubiquitin protease, partial [Triangularia setosa]